MIIFSSLLTVSLLHTVFASRKSASLGLTRGWPASCPVAAGRL